MPTINMTVRAVQAIQPNGRRIEYQDSKLPGFYVRVGTDGGRTFGVRYRFRGRKRRLTIGSADAWTLAEARDRARDAIRLAAKGERDMASEKTEAREAATFSELAAAYLERWAKPRKRSWREDARIIDRYLNPAFGAVKIQDVRRAEIRRLLDGIATHAPIMANRVLACARKIYNWAISQDLAETSPCDRVPAPTQPRRRDRVLSDDEIRALWAALDSSDSIIADVYKLRLLTAQRGGEVIGMRWDEVDLDSGVWTIPAERSKNKLVHRVPLSDAAIQILQRRKAEGIDTEARRAKRQGRDTDAIEFVFPGRRRGRPIAETKRAKQAIADAAALDSPWVGHDLRRTAATRMAEAGTPRTVIGRVLNHSEQSVTAIYDRYGYDREKREALESWARRLAVIVSGLKAVEGPNLSSR